MANIFLILLGLGFLHGELANRIACLALSLASEACRDLLGHTTTFQAALAGCTNGSLQSLVSRDLLDSLKLFQGLFHEYEVGLIEVTGCVLGLFWTLVFRYGLIFHTSLLFQTADRAVLFTLEFLCLILRAQNSDAISSDTEIPWLSCLKIILVLPIYLTLPFLKERARYWVCSFGTFPDRMEVYSVDTRSLVLVLLMLLNG